MSMVVIISNKIVMENIVLQFVNLMRILLSIGFKMIDVWFVICVSEFVCVNWFFFINFGKIDLFVDQKKVLVSLKNKVNKVNVYSVILLMINYVRMVVIRIV